MNDEDVRDVMMTLFRRKYAEAERTKIASREHMLPEYLRSALDEGELPVLLIFGGDGATKIASVLTTRRVAVLANDAVTALFYRDIVDFQMVPFPRTKFGELSRLKVVGRDGVVLFIQADPGEPYNGVLALIQNRVHAARFAASAPEG